MNIRRNQIGKEGEDLAQEFLIQENYKILERNYRNLLGEIDFIAEHKSVICFIEVKTRTDDQKGSPLEAVTPRKQKKISQVALSYLKETNRIDSQARFDVVSILKFSDEKPEIELVEDAFGLSEPYSY